MCVAPGAATQPGHPSGILGTLHPALAAQDDSVDVTREDLCSVRTSGVRTPPEYDFMGSTSTHDKCDYTPSQTSARQLTTLDVICDL